MPRTARRTEALRDDPEQGLQPGQKWEARKQRVHWVEQQTAGCKAEVEEYRGRLMRTEAERTDQPQTS